MHWTCRATTAKKPKKGPANSTAKAPKANKQPKSRASKSKKDSAGQNPKKQAQANGGKGPHSEKPRTKTAAVSPMVMVVNSLVLSPFFTKRNYRGRMV